MSDEQPSIIDNLPALAAAGIQMRFGRMAEDLTQALAHALEQENFYMKAAAFGYSREDADQFLEQAQGPYAAGSSPTATDRAAAAACMRQAWRPDRCHTRLSDST